MDKQLIENIASFSNTSQGRSELANEVMYVMSEKGDKYAPVAYLEKSFGDEYSLENFLGTGYTCSSLTFLDIKNFDSWYQGTFNKKLSAKKRKEVRIVHQPDINRIFDTVDIVNQVYAILKDSKIIVNGKNLPIQLGEWYAKMIFGLIQQKSSSQRGFDFHTMNNSKVEVKVHWHDSTSPKGVKLKKSLLELSDYCIIMYVARDFKIRDILFLDSDFVLRKFGAKGHTIFLKDSDVSSYFFSRSDKHLGKIVNKSILFKFCSVNLAMKLDERLT